MSGDGNQSRWSKLPSMLGMGTKSSGLGLLGDKNSPLLGSNNDGASKFQSLLSPSVNGK